MFKNSDVIVKDVEDEDDLMLQVLTSKAGHVIYNDAGKPVAGFRIKMKKGVQPVEEAKEVKEVVSFISPLVRAARTLNGEPMYPDHLKPDTLFDLCIFSRGKDSTPEQPVFSEKKFTGFSNFQK